MFRNKEACNLPIYNKVPLDTGTLGVVVSGEDYFTLVTLITTGFHCIIDLLELTAWSQKYSIYDLRSPLKLLNISIRFQKIEYLPSNFQGQLLFFFLIYILLRHKAYNGYFYGKSVSFLTLIIILRLLWHSMSLKLQFSRDAYQY